MTQLLNLFKIIIINTCFILEKYIYYINIFAMEYVIVRCVVMVRTHIT